jgi:hypothetical protein
MGSVTLRRDLRYLDHCADPPISKAHEETELTRSHGIAWMDRKRPPVASDYFECFVALDVTAAESRR